MKKTPRIRIHLDKIAANGRLVLEQAAARGVRLTGVVKGAAGDLTIAACLIAAGLTEIGDSRLENLKRFRFGPQIRRVLLRLPSPSRIAATVRFSDCSLNSEVATLEMLNATGRAGGCAHEVMLMVDMGDLREGFAADRIDHLGSVCRGLGNLRITGLGVNFSCFAGAVPTVPKLERLTELARILKDEYQLPIQAVSGGNSSSLPLLFDGALPPGINHLRIGEGILLGRETLSGEILPGLDGGAFEAVAEVIQAQHKPAVSQGPTGRDAFGRIPCIPNAPAGMRYLLNIGHQDTPLSGLTSLDPELIVLGGSSDYLVAAGPAKYRVGDELSFRPDYWSLLALMTSRYVAKEYLS